MSMTTDEDDTWRTGSRRYTRLCGALGINNVSNDVYDDFRRAFQWPMNNYHFFTELGADKYAWMDGPHIEVVYRVMLARLADG